MRRKPLIFTAIAALSLSMMGASAYAVRNLWAASAAPAPSQEPVLDRVGVRSLAPDEVAFGNPKLGQGSMKASFGSPTFGRSSMYEMNRLEVEAVGSTVLISADARLKDSHPGNSYVWSFLVLDPDGEDVVYERRYDHQMFTMPVIGEWVDLDLAEILDLPLPPGRYPVRVLIYRIPAGEGLDFVDGVDPLSPGKGVSAQGGAVIDIR